MSQRPAWSSSRPCSTASATRAPAPAAVPPPSSLPRTIVSIPIPASTCSPSTAVRGRAQRPRRPGPQRLEQQLAKNLYTQGPPRDQCRSRAGRTGHQAEPELHQSADLQMYAEVAYYATTTTVCAPRAAGTSAPSRPSVLARGSGPGRRGERSHGRRPAHRPAERAQP